MLKKKMKPELLISVQEFLRTVQQSRVPASEMLTMDEAGIRSTDISPYTYAKKRSKDVGLVVPNESATRVIIATLWGDGSTLLSFWVQHRNANERKKAKKQLEK